MTVSSIQPEREFTILLDEPLPPVEQRATPRYRFDLATLVQLHLPIGTGVKLEAWAFDLSERGIGLNLPYPLEVSSQVVLCLRGRRTSGTVTMPARVIHATEQANGSWRIGCTFDKPLCDTLEALL